MSLYNMIYGMNGNLALILSCILGFRIDKEIPRFRDVFLKAQDELLKIDKCFIIFVFVVAFVQLILELVK